MKCRIPVPVFVVLAIILVVGSGLAGCRSTTTTTSTPVITSTPAATTTTRPTTTTTTSSTPSTTTTTTSTTATTATPTGSVKPIVLKLTTHNPPALSVSQTEQKWADKIKEMSGGRLQFQLYYSEALAKQTEVYNAVRTGVADIGYMVVGSDASQTPLSMMTRRTFMGIPSMKASAQILWDLYNKYPEIRAEWKNMKMLTINGLPPDQFFFVKKAVRVPDDMKGMKVIARGDYPAIMEAIGAVPIGLNVADWFSSVEKGLVEGQVGIHFLAVNSFKLLEYYKYYTIFGDGGADMANEAHLINQDTWNSLPPDLQQILLDSAKWYEAEELIATQTGYDAGVKAGQDAKGTFTNLTPAEIDTWRKVVDPLDKKYIQDNASKGPAQAIYDEIKALTQKYANLK